MTQGYSRDTLSALDAITEAQKIAHAPMLFQAAWALRELGLLGALEEADRAGLSLAELAERCGISEYGAGVLLDMGLSARIVWLDAERYVLGRVGHFLLNDPMTRINMDFTQHVCYGAMAHLIDAIRTGRPEGLKVFGDWSSIYPHLSDLPEPARGAWFCYDHFYSDQAFEDVLEHVFRHPPTHLYDIGGNTGRWAMRCIRHDPSVKVTILDLPEQTSLAQEQIAAQGLQGRIATHAVDILHADTLPAEADAYWMSQFLDCFSEAEITRILELIRRTMRPDARVFILDLYWDRQRFEGAAYCLNATSLYFTALANGNSRFYHSKTMLRCLQAAGFYVEDDIDGIGLGHTLMVCRARSR